MTPAALIAAVRGRLEAATLGPWVAKHATVLSWVETAREDDVGERMLRDDATLIANAPTDLTALCDALEQSEVRVERLESERDTAVDDLAEYVASAVRRVKRLERVLAAEQGREGLEGWKWAGWFWKRIPTVTQKACAVQIDKKQSPWLRSVWRFDWHDGERWHDGLFSTALEAMEAAEAALAGGGA